MRFGNVQLSQENEVTFAAVQLHSSQNQSLQISLFHRMNIEEDLPESPESPIPVEKLPQHSCVQDFQILRKIGEGTYSSVFKVRRWADDTIYALKKIKLDKMARREQESALNEVRILASLAHQNIIAYRDAFYQKGCLFLVLQFAEGGDLAAEIALRKREKSHFSQVEIWQVLLQLSLALAALHAQKIMHRDIKPANVFLTKRGVAKLGDLNVSKISSQLCQTQAGTPYYASPEIWRDQPYDKSSDIWSLGCTLYEMAALSPPFLGQDLQEIFFQVTEGVSPPLPLFYSKELHKIISLMLEKDPKRRPSAQRILQKVERILPEAFKGLAIVQRVRAQFKHKQSCSVELLKTIHFPKGKERRENEANSCLPSPSFSRDNSLDELTPLATSTVHLQKGHSKHARGKTSKKGVSLYANGGKENAVFYFKKHKELVVRGKEGKLPQIKKKTMIK